LAQEEFRLLATALLLSRFTKAELARSAGANVNTVASWLNRNRQFFALERAPTAPLPGKGRPRNVWRVQNDAIAEMRQRLGKLEPPQRLTIADLPGDGQLRTLRRVEVQLETWRRVVRTGDEIAASEQLVKTRSWIRMAWEDFADLEIAGIEVPSTHLRQLAELEKEAGAGSLPGDSALPQITVWLTRRLSAMVDRGVSLDFAGRTVRVRSEVRSEADRVKLTAASSAAPVWSDEGLADEEGLEVTAINLCKVVAQHVPASQRVREVAIAIGPSKPWSYCRNEEEAQAVVLGLATQFGRVEPEVGSWLAGLHVCEAWRPELALAVVRGLADAEGVILRQVMRSVAQTLQEVLDRPPLSRTEPGQVRKDAWRYCKLAIATDVTANDAITRSLRYSSTLAYRPKFPTDGTS
jgi:hypothetical protein